MKLKAISLIFFYLILSFVNGAFIDTEIEELPLMTYSAPMNNACEPLLLNSVNEQYHKQINIVVFPYSNGTKTYEEMKETIKRGLIENEEALFNLEPFKTRKNEFNVWLHKEEFLPIEPLSRENINAYLLKAKECPVNYVIVISIIPVRGSRSRYYGFALTGVNYQAIRTELGGLIGYLVDEWVYGNPEVLIAYPINCDTSPTCDKFADLNPSGCFLGCTRGDYYRTEFKTVMGGGGDTFGTVNEYIINKRIDLQLEKNLNDCVFNCGNGDNGLPQPKTLLESLIEWILSFLRTLLGWR